MIQETLTLDSKSSIRSSVHHHHRPSTQQEHWLNRGLDQPGGKLPLFDEWGQRISERTVKSCIEQGWAEPWFTNPLKPDWLVCKLTDAGRAAITKQ